MPTKLPPHFIDLVQNALHKSFWTKNALKRFLRRSSVSDEFLGQLDHDETKREWLERLFPKLESSDRGQALIQQMAQGLADQSTFPDLQNWEDSAQKIRDAKDAVARLMQYLDKKAEEKKQALQSEAVRQAARQQQAANLASKETLESLSNRLNDLSSQLGFQQSGYEFQVWFYDLMNFAEVPNRRPYIDPNGRQIDGSVTIDGTTYICELKFTQKQAPPKEVSDLRDKVRTKADNTMAILLSISGFTDGAIRTGSGDGTPLLLLEASHLYCCLTGVMPFPDLIRRLRRHSSQTGEAFLPPAKFGGQS